MCTAASRYVVSRELFYVVRWGTHATLAHLRVGDARNLLPSLATKQRNHNLLNSCGCGSSCMSRLLSGLI